LIIWESGEIEKGRRWILKKRKKVNKKKLKKKEKTV
jgi:hypothetical protein